MAKFDTFVMLFKSAILLCIVLSTCLAVSNCPDPIPKGGIPRYEDWIANRHDEFLKEVETSDADVVFIGDAIINKLKQSTVYKLNINFSVINLGMDGDSVENVLWRIQNGELNFKKTVKVVVLSVGTENTGCDPEVTYDGIVGVIQTIKEKLIGVHVVVLTLLPRWSLPNENRFHNIQVNCFLIYEFGYYSKNAMIENVHLLRIDQHIMDEDKYIPKEILSDGFYPTDEGYTLIFGPVLRYVTDLVNGRIYNPVIGRNCTNL